MINIDPILVQFILGPTLGVVLTALLVKVRATNRVKVIVTALVALVVAFVGDNVVAETGYATFSWESLVAYVVAFLSSSTSYQSFWKPALNLEQRPLMLPDKGIG